MVIRYNEAIMLTHAKSRRNILVLSVTAAIIYNSWPLGYLLNAAVSRSSLASGLEAVGQPYNWLFIAGDTLSSLIIIAVCAWLYRYISKTEIPRFEQIALVSLILFGIGTIVDALLPERCVPNLQQCPSFTQDHLLLFHGIFSILASVALFVAVTVIWLRRRHNPILVSLLIGYLVFGIISFIEAVAPGNNGNWSQHYYITLCSVGLVTVLYILSRVI